MTIRLSSVQVTRIQEAMDSYFTKKWSLKLATEDFVEDILNIVLPTEDKDDHKHSQESGTCSGMQ